MTLVVASNKLCVKDESGAVSMSELVPGSQASAGRPFVTGTNDCRSEMTIFCSTPGVG